MSNMPEARKKLLISIAKDGKSEKNALKSPSTFQSALRVLHDKGVLRREADSYSISNRLLAIWLKREY